MKDNQLNEKFGEYFRGIETPENITADAKRSVTPPKPLLPRLFRWAAAAASILIICVVSVLMLNNLPSVGNNGASAPSSFGNDSPGGEASNTPGGMPENPDSPDAPATPDDGASEIDWGSYYDKTTLTGQYCNPYGAKDLHSSLAFISAVCESRNANVTECTAYYSGGALALVESEISLLDGLNRYDTSVYVELTDKTYLPLANYSDGEKRSYKGYTYYLTRSVAVNGEPEFKVLIENGGVKYYFDVVSSDENSYLKLLKLFFG